jgi:flagellar biosynthesis/type III secretory pathway protein FliH
VEKEEMRRLIAPLTSPTSSVSLSRLANDGESLGLSLGRSEGALEGIKEGAADGAAEGELDGLQEGTAEGLADGTSYGFADGSMLVDGLTDGSMLIDGLALSLSLQSPEHTQLLCSSIRQLPQPSRS